jgi:hypothetical protein
MALMIPARPMRDNAAEKTMLAAFKKLDERYVIFYSIDILQRNLQDKLYDGECDFLVFDTKQAVILCLEVKGGTVRYDGDSGLWYQNDHQLKQSPYTQAKNYRYAIENFLKQKLSLSQIPVTFGYGVCFPDVFTDVGRDLPEMDPQLAITGQTINYIGEAIEAIEGLWQQKYTSNLSPAEMARIRQALMPRFEYGASLCDQIGREERQFFSLTENQCQLLTMLGTRKRALIEGCAGSGKTVMALKKARELAAAGQKVLLLAYNRPLGEILEKQVRDWDGEITAGHYHAFCLRTMKAAGCDVAVPAKAPDFWSQTLPTLFADFLAEHPLKFDALIVDEAQDFREDYWLSMMDLLGEESTCFLFYDPTQNLFRTRMQFPIEDEPFLLTSNCRNTQAIVDKIAEVTGVLMLTMDGLPPGEPVAEFSSPNPTLRRKELGRMLHRLIQENGLTAERVIVLGGHGLPHTCLGSSPRVGSFTIAEIADKPLPTGTVPYYTYMKFKGCEADAVILLDVDTDDPRWNPEGLYTAMSRAKHFLGIIRTARGQSASQV